MGRVKFKHARPKELNTRRTLLELLAPQVKVFELFPIRDGIIVRTGSEDDEDIIFQEATQEKLREAGFTAVMPPELRSRRTVICFRVDELAYEHDAEEIKTELEKQQSWMKVDEVYKFSGSRTIKIICASCEMARKALDSGILLFYISIPPYQMKIEDYTPLLACNRCQAIEEHDTNDCPRPTDYTACSECASKEHTFRECKSTEKKCLNCGNGHSARAMRCPVRKKALREKQARLRREKEEKKKASYAQAAQTPQAPIPATSAPPSGFHSPGFMLLLEAHLADCAVPGIFQNFLSESLTLNGLPDLKIPPRPPSTDIIRAIAGDALVVLAQRAQLSPEYTECRNKEFHTQAEAAYTPEGQAPTPTTILPSEEETTSEEEGEEEEQDEEGQGDRPPTPPLSMRVLKRNRDVFPDNYPHKIIRKRVHEGRYILTHKGTEEDTERVKTWFWATTKPIDSYCVTVTDEEFDQIKDGPSPPEMEQCVNRNGRKRRPRK